MRGFIFDIDGTLLDSNDAHAECLQLALKHAGFGFHYETVRRTIGMGFDQLLPRLTGLDSESAVGRKIGEQKDALFKEKFPTLLPFADAQRLIATLYDQGFKITIATSASQSDLKKFLEKLEIEKYIHSPVSADDIEHSKPAPDVVEEALKTLKLGANDVLMVGDTPYDIEAAKKAKVKTIAFRSGGWNDAELKDAALVVDGPSELLQMLNSASLLQSIG